MDVIEDRTVLEAGNVHYVACIVADEFSSNPYKDWDQLGSFYVPNWDYEDRGRAHLAELIDGLDSPDVDTSKMSRRLRDKTEDCSWYEDSHASDWRELYQRSDPSGIYLIVQYNESRYGGNALNVMDDDDESTRNYAILYMTAERIRTEYNVKRITKAIRDQTREALTSELAPFNAWANGEVYGYYTLRQVLDDDGETISSEEVEDGSCWGYYGSDEWEYMYSEAKRSAEYDHAAREEVRHAAYASLDLFDAASYPETSIDDAIGAFHARINEGFAAIGEVTRKLSPIAIG